MKCDIIVVEKIGYKCCSYVFHPYYHGMHQSDTSIYFWSWTLGVISNEYVSWNCVFLNQNASWTKMQQWDFVWWVILGQQQLIWWDSIWNKEINYTCFGPFLALVLGQIGQNTTIRRWHRKVQIVISNQHKPWLSVPAKKNPHMYHWG